MHATALDAHEAGGVLWLAPVPLLLTVFLALTVLGITCLMSVLVTLLASNQVVSPIVGALGSTAHNINLTKTFNIDSGAEVHVCNDASWFDNLTMQDINVFGVSTSTTRAKGVGTITFYPVNTEGLEVPIQLANVYYIP